MILHAQALLLSSIILMKSVPIVRSLAQPNPKSFTDDPFIDDEKFTEKGKRIKYFQWKARLIHGPLDIEF